ncbi:MAG: glycoside hydrolase family 3 protein [Phototrophicaceae bacterium]
MLQITYSFDGETVPQALLDGVQRGEVSSFCLFAGKNITSARQLRELTNSLYEAAEAGNQPPPIIGTDQEGGQLMALAEGTPLPGNLALGATRSTDLAWQAGQVLAKELLAVGINMNYAPSVDILYNPDNPVIGTRSFGDDPALVGQLGAAMIQGMQYEGVIASAKHFPGHGDTEGDTHHTATHLRVSRQRLDEIELAPFRDAIRAGVGAIMSAHITVDVIDPENPATISRAILTDLLRGELGYTGLTITDAMDMHAVARFGHLQSVRAALQAGADLILLGHIEGQAALAAQVRDLAQPAALQRIQAARALLPTFLPTLEVIRSAEHMAVAQQIADRSMTLVRDNGRLPLQLSPEQRIAVITVLPENLTPADTSASVAISLVDEVRAFHSQTDSYTFQRNATADELHRLLDATASADGVIVGTINAADDPSQVELVRALHERGHAPIVVALRMPSDAAVLPMAETVLCTYSIRSMSMNAAARVLFGKLEATGVLPCRLPTPTI